MQKDEIAPEGLDIEETAAKKRKIDKDNVEITKIVDEKRKKVKRKKKRRKRKKFKPPGRKSKIVEKEYETEVDYLKEVLEEKKKKMEDLRKTLEEKTGKDTKEKDEKLTNLAEKWQEACEDILREIHSEWEKKLPDSKMNNILKQYRVPPNMVSYDEEEDEFEFFKSQY